MAKIGNEAKLILKLADERARITPRRYRDRSDEYQAGYSQALNDYREGLHLIVHEIEER